MTEKTKWVCSGCYHACECELDEKYIPVTCILYQSEWRKPRGDGAGTIGRHEWCKNE